ncbi:MAG: winged helix-turn-helix domain-containing protein [candidate division Zixibacteria bacterium]|nr:winged helix-turn-helix domain-containing protein [candidate division Zixibacteria bacterium]
MNISTKLARRITINSQFLDGKAKFPKGKEGVADLIEQLGYIQIDTLAVIQRAHHHTLWTRIPNYSLDYLDELQVKDRRIFEYWGHALSYLPMCDYKYYLPRMKQFYDPYGKWEKERLEKYGHLLKPVLNRVRKEGSLSNRDFSKLNKRTPEYGERPNPEAAALEMLFWRGEVMITERRNFHRVYDLTERVLPKGIDTSFPNDEDLGQFLVRRALSSYGIATEKEIRDHIHAAGKEIIADALRNLTEAGEVNQVTVEKRKTIYYALAENISSLSKLKKKKPQLHLLSPFDNLIIQRGRIEELFGFEYALECYVTPSKRVHGYFVLPILWGEEFIGRFDPKADRKAKTLIINNLKFEEGFTSFDDVIPAFAIKLREMAEFNGCEKIRIEKTTPSKIKAKIVKRVKQEME